MSEKTAYHHGEVSLQATIVNMAQNYVGANNINLLEPLGQFGTRLTGGKDAASARYIFTRLSPLARALFPKADDALLRYLDDDGLTVEPEWYAPVLPTVLLNGAAGIGTGWSTTVLSYNPRDIIGQLRAIMAGFEPEEIHPWYRGFTGTVTPRAAKDGGYAIDGCIEEVGAAAVRVTELPIEEWTQSYKEYLEEQLAAGAIKDYKNHSTDTTVDFWIELNSEAALAEARKVGLKKKFKLSSTASTSNMVLFDAEHKLQRYATVTDIVKDFYRVRMPLYEQRKRHMADALCAELVRLENQARFIDEVCTQRLKISNRKRSELITDLVARAFVALPSGRAAKAQVAGDVANAANAAADADPEADDSEQGREEAAANAAAGVKTYDYLLSMPIWSLTYEKVTSLQTIVRQKRAELDALLATPPSALWERDLEALEVALDEHEALLVEVEMRGMHGGKGGAKGRGGAAAARKAPAKKYADSDDEDEAADSESEFDEDDDDFGARKKKGKKAAASKKKEEAAPSGPSAHHLAALSSKRASSSSASSAAAAAVAAGASGRPLQMIVQKSTGAAAVRESAKFAAAAAAAPMAEEDIEELSLFERLQRRSAMAASSASAASSSSSSSSSGVAAVAKMAAAAKTSAAATKSAGATKRLPSGKAPSKKASMSMSFAFCHVHRHLCLVSLILMCYML